MWKEITFILVHPRLVRSYPLDERGNAQFQAQYKDGECIYCTFEDGIVLKVPKREFKAIYDKWEKYVSGDLSIKWGNESSFTKCTAGIIHQYLDQLSKIGNSNYA